MIDPDIKQSVSELVDETTGYMKTYAELLKVKTVKHTTNIASHIVIVVLLMLCTSVGLVFMSVGLANWLNKVCGNPYAGYYIVGGFYLLIGILVILLYNKVLLRVLRDTFLKKIYDEDQQL